MSLPRLLLTCAAGSPEDPKTWSGTPSHILNALREEGRLEPIPYASPLKGRHDLWARSLDRALGLQHKFIYGPVRRQFSGSAASAAARAADCYASLHLGTYDMPLLGHRLPRYLFVDNNYDLWERQARDAQQLSPHQKRWFRRLEKQALSQAKHVFTVGQHVADNFIDAWGLPRNKVTAVGTGLGGIKPYFGPKDYTRGRLLIVAKVRPHEKGLPLLLEAFTLARRQRPELQLTVIGGAKDPSVIGCEGVHGTGWITAEELQRIFEESCLFVMPATYEPWGLSYLEALACRTPVVGLSRNALPEISGNGRFGFLLPSTSVSELAEMLLRALSDPQHLEIMGNAGQKHCLERYQWSKVARAISDTVAQHKGSECT